MEYSEKKEKIIMTEYGRNIQQMVAHAVTLSDKTEREQCVKTIIHTMGNLFPYLRDVNDFRHKLWDHLAIMSDFKLDIEFPFETPSPETFSTRPDTIPYTNQSAVKQLHYGRVIEDMIEKAMTLEEGEMRDCFIVSIANQMKKNYVIWNKENVDDSKILKDLYNMSRGKINVSPEQLKLFSSKDLLAKRPNNNNGGNSNGKNNNNRGQQKRNNNKKR